MSQPVTEFLLRKTAFAAAWTSAGDTPSRRSGRDVDAREAGGQRLSYAVGAAEEVVEPVDLLGADAPIDPVDLLGVGASTKRAISASRAASAWAGVTSGLDTTVNRKGCALSPVEE